MFIRKIAIMAALCALAVVGAASASAATYVHKTTSTGNVAPSGSAVAGTQTGTALLTSSSGNISCTSGSFSGTVGASGGATVTGSLSALSFSTCTDSIPLITVTGCSAINTGSTGIVASSSSSTGGSLNLTSVQVQCNFSGGGNCVFSASTANGTYTNSTGNLVYSNVATTSNGFGCPSTGTFSATYNPVNVTVGGTAGKVILNNTL